MKEANFHCPIETAMSYAWSSLSWWSPRLSKYGEDNGIVDIKGRTNDCQFVTSPAASGPFIASLRKARFPIAYSGRYTWQEQ